MAGPHFQSRRVTSKDFAHYTPLQTIVAVNYEKLKEIKASFTLYLARDVSQAFASIEKSFIGSEKKVCTAKSNCGHLNRVESNLGGHKNAQAGDVNYYVSVGTSDGKLFHKFDVKVKVTYGANGQILSSAATILKSQVTDTRNQELCIPKLLDSGATTLPFGPRVADNKAK